MRMRYENQKVANYLTADYFDLFEVIFYFLP